MKRLMIAASLQELNLNDPHFSITISYPVFHHPCSTPIPMLFAGKTHHPWRGVAYYKRHF